METVSHIINNIASLPPEVWAMIGGSIGLSALQQKIKRWFQLQNPKFLVLLTGMLSALGVAITVFIGWVSTQPQLMVAYGATWFTGMTLAYRYIVQPAGNTLKKWNDEVAAYKQYKANKGTFDNPNYVIPQEVVDEVPTAAAAQVAAVEQPQPAVAEFQG